MLLESASTNNTNGVLLALQAHEDVNQRGLQGETALHWAATYGNLEMIELLLKAGANIVFKDFKDQIPLD